MGDKWGNALGDAAAGAALGSTFLPGIGTGVGAAIGGLLGYFTTPDDPTPAQSATDPSMAAIQKRQQDLYNQVANQQNPFGQQYLSNLQNQAKMQFDPQQQALSGQLYSRGMMGSGQEAARRAALQGQQQSSLLGLQNQVADQAANWQSNQTAQLAGLLGQQTGTYFNQQQLGMQQQQNQNNLYSGIASAGGQIVGAALPKILDKVWK